MACAKRFQVSRKVWWLNKSFGEFIILLFRFYNATKVKFPNTVVPDKFVPIEATKIKIEGQSKGGVTSGERYLNYDFSQHFGYNEDSVGYKEITLYPGQYLGIVDGHIGYT